MRRTLLLALALAVIAAGAILVLTYEKAPGGSSVSLREASGAGALPEGAESSDTANNQVPERVLSAGPAVIPVPSQYALVPGLTIPAAESWEGLVSMLLPDERALVEALRSRYPEAYNFKSIKQLRWLVEHGYPMPSEIVAAHALSMEELKQRATNGNVKAAMLARDRLLAEAVAQAERTGQPIFDSPLAAEIHFMEMIVRGRNCSPFSYYISARYYEEVSRARGANDTSILGTLAAHAVVASMGDRRSQDYAQRLAGAFPLDGRTAMELAQWTIVERRTVPPNCPESRFPLN